MLLEKLFGLLGDLLGLHWEENSCTILIGHSRIGCTEVVLESLGTTQIQTTDLTALRLRVGVKKTLVKVKT